MSLVAGFLPLMASTSYAIKVPKTLHAALKLISGPGSASRPQRLPIAATEIGLKWLGSGAAPSIRTSSNAQQWTSWRRLEESEDMFDEETSTHYSALIPGRGARWVQVRSGRGIDKRSITVQAMNTKDGPLRKIYLTRSAWGATGQPPVIPRAAWGADESIRRSSPRFARVRKLFVHHTATAINRADPAASIRAIYSYHVNVRGWDDIGYNFLVDPKGAIYEGRYSRGYSGGQSPTGEDANGMGVIGSHVGGHNVGSAGIAVLGDSSRTATDSRAVGALVGFLSWKADRHGLTPHGSGPFTNTDGEAVRLPNIAAHKDVSSAVTDCPGTSLSRGMPALKDRAEEAIAQQSGLSPPDMPTGTVLIPGSPSADPTPEVAGAVSRSAVRVDVSFASNRGTTRTVSVAPRDGSFVVSDPVYNGNPLRPGVYSVRAVAFDAAGRASAQAPVADGFTISGREGLLPPLPIIEDGSLPDPLEQPVNGLVGTVTGLLKGLGL